MKWEKRGLIYGPDGSSGWARHSALQPTPLLRAAQGSIRVFVGMRDSEGVGRIGFVDVSAENPSKVLRVSNSPVLDIGGPGAFDDNGVIPSAIVEREGRLYLFYAGYQLVRKVKFLAFGGVAISDDDGETFTRYSRAPICDRTNDEVCFRVIHTMMFDDGRWRAWYGGGDSFEVEQDKQYPRYNVRHAESPDGMHLSEDYQVCIDMSGAEHRVGRPYVIKDGSLYRMFYGAGTKENGYRLGYAESMDGVDWTRKDREIGIDISASGWDSQMQAFPSVVRYDAQTFLFYNGNDYGREGFGYAVLEHW
jgi:hypothetical protein